MVNEEILKNDLLLLSKSYYKVIEVNLNEDTYFEVKINDAEPHVYEGLQKWVEAFASTGVHPDDKMRFKKFFNPVKINGKIFYRRKIDEEWHWVCMEVIPFENYSVDDAIVLITVKDIEDYYDEIFDTIKTVVAAWK